MSTQERTHPLPEASEFSGLAECIDRLAARKRRSRPVSTYRLQFHAGFRLPDARRLVPYLHALGVTHIYSSPVLMARAGSTHGYDIIDHNQINPEIGSEQDFRDFAAELRARGMGLVLDFVPNHMGVGLGSNPWWQDVLQNGRSSEYAGFFDIDWRPLKRELRNEVLLPVLGDQYGAELEAGRLRLSFEDGSFRIRYYDTVLPIDPQTLPLLLEEMAQRWQENGTDSSAMRELRDVLDGLHNLPPHSSTKPEPVADRRERAPKLLDRLAHLVRNSTELERMVAQTIADFNGQAGEPHSFDRLHALLEMQAYRLAHWRVSAEEINYRRFFDVNDLVGLRMEDPKVFDATHRLLRRLFAEGVIHGLRIDHPDGLFNPPQYFMRVQMLYAASQCCGALPFGPLAENGIEQAVQEVFGQHSWNHNLAPLYLLIEKILEPGEGLPLEWPVDGSVGYDFANLLNGVFIQPANERFFTNLYQRFAGTSSDVDTLVYQSKKLIMDTALSSEVNVLTRMLAEICSQDRRARDFTRKTLSDAIRETIACFPVYRTYIDERGNISERDRGYIGEAIVRAKRRNEAMPAALFDFLRDILLLRTGEANSRDYDNRLFFALKFQQLTGPVMAKGLEDTACYVYNRLISVNEVGGTPKSFGVPVDDFHRANLFRLEQWPYSMLATSTHDTKRSEDVRARVNVLSEFPKPWSAAVMRWRRSNRAKKRTLSDGRSVPDANEEYLLYQTLAGTYPFAIGSEAERQEYITRIQQYMHKALHEAKAHMSWINPNPEYVDAVQEFVARILTPGRANRFVDDLEKFAGPVSFFGAINSLAQTLLKATAPGVPDVYQGAESWDFSLVDPDNRRAVDFGSRVRLLDELQHEAETLGLPTLCAGLLANYADGRAKLWTTARALDFRRAHPELFQGGDYRPLYGAVEKQDHVCAFLRSAGREVAVTAVPRFACTLMRGEPRAPLGDAWGKAELALPPGAPIEFRNVLTGTVLRQTGARTLLCRELFAEFPVALLTRR